MARSYKYAVIRFAPNEIRGERLNIGALVVNDFGVDVHITRRIERIRAISAAVDYDSLQSLLSNLKTLDAQARKSGISEPEARLENLARVGPLELSKFGTFVAENQISYEQRITTIMQMLVEPEPAPARPKVKKTKLFSQLKKSFRDERVLALESEGLESHRIVTAYELDDGLVADMVLRNGAYHIVETVDASGDEHSFRKTVTDIAVSALVLERARMHFGDNSTKGRLVYTASSVLERVARPSLDAAQNQGAELINWESASDRNSFIHELCSMATPVENKKKKMFVSPIEGGLFN
jgi:hypothetical protein